MKDLRIEFREKSEAGFRFVDLVVVNKETNTVRKFHFDMEPGNSALAKQMNQKTWEKIHKTIEDTKAEFESGAWDDERFYNQVV